MRIISMIVTIMHIIIIVHIIIKRVSLVPCSPASAYIIVEKDRIIYVLYSLLVIVMHILSLCLVALLLQLPHDAGAGVAGGAWGRLMYV